MPNSSPDLWPDDIGAGSLRTPVSILKEQAALLASKTDYEVAAEVVTKHDEKTNFLHSFYLVVPALDNYKYRLLSILHGVGLYPLVITAEVLQDQIRVENEESFVDKIRQIFSSEKTKNIVRSLRGQIRD